uniref:Uncharacterized protein n=1 Tax=Fagus sylvatica TaxID=28930 RepID=A0A2N9G0T1_FAGSY
MCTGRLTTAHNPPLDVPRLEGDAHPANGESHPSLNRWLAVPWMTHGQGCRSGGDPPRLPVWRATAGCRLGLPCRIPAGLEVTHGQACRLGLPCPPE